MNKLLKNRWIRFFFGLMMALVTVVVGFGISFPVVQTWGSTPTEIAAKLPGDELLDKPIVKWSHAETINAPVDQVWKWIAQMGDTRGGFYSYTWIEKLISGIQYTNANAIVPEWQNPQVGDQIITGSMQLSEIKTGQYMLGTPVKNDFGWTWLWYITPLENNQTRLVVHMGIQVPGVENPLMTSIINLGAWIMENNMLQGLKLRAEGGSEPASIEMIEFVIWVIALLTGVVSAVFYMIRKTWYKPLWVGLASIAALIVFTFVQPEIWVRVVADLILIGGLVWAIMPEQKSLPVVALRPAQG